MNLKYITHEIYYTGVNDRVTTLFEGLWPLPSGVSYNSYLVGGADCMALIDTVRIDEVREFLSSVSSIANGRDIHYLVVNHMEPDHSGSIPEVVREYPDIKIVGNSQTISMIKGFYGIDDSQRFLEVKDGDELDLGGRRLKFFLTPMVHWPETMMTYVEDCKVLFSGDAFGTFGALNGAVIDTDFDTDPYISEMYRYYSNIVGKYGKFVERALAKVGSLPMDYICSTHGPIWHSRIPEVVALTADLAAYRSEPGVTVIYGSMYGNTAELAELIAAELHRAGVRNVKVHNASKSSMSEMISDAYRYKGLIVGSATYSMRLLPPVEQLMNALETREIKGKVFAAFGSYTWAQGAVLKALEHYSTHMKMPIVASMAMKQTLDDNSREEAKALAQTVARKLAEECGC